MIIILSVFEFPGAMHLLHGRGCTENEVAKNFVPQAWRDSPRACGCASHHCATLVRLFLDCRQFVFNGCLCISWIGADGFVAALICQGATKLVPQAWRAYLPYDQIHTLKGVPAITVQLSVSQVAAFSNTDVQ